MLSTPGARISREFRKIRTIYPRDYYILARRNFRNTSQNREIPPRITSFFEKYPLDVTWPNSQDLSIEGKGCGTSGSPRGRIRSTEREKNSRIARSTRIIGSGWKQRNPLIETWPPRRFNHLSRIPIYVTVIKGGGAQTCGPSFVNSWEEYKAALKFLMRRGKRIECEIRLVEFLSIKFSWKLPTVGD